MSPRHRYLPPIPWNAAESSAGIRLRPNQPPRLPAVAAEPRKAILRVMRTRPSDAPSATESHTRLHVLDAGCGRRIPELELGLDRPRHVVGIDISPVALELNELLDEKILGDLQTYPFRDSSFDLIVCWDVLEHLPQPRRALDNLARALKPGGRMIIGLPNLLSPKALATKFTPHWFHIWYYRRVLKYPESGRPGFGPFRTYLRWTLRPGAIERFAVQVGLEVETLERYEPESWKLFWKRHPHLLALLLVVWGRALDGADPRQSELRVVLVKPGS